jgi:hypothetical protein
LFTKFTTRNRKNKQENQSFFIETILTGKMDVKPKDEDGVNGRGVVGWDVWFGCGGRLIDIRVGT